jgi:membrane-associated phospholipid phosphatase
LFVITLHSVFPQNPYKLSYEKEIPLISSGIVISLLDLHLINNKQPVSPEELNTISLENVNSLDVSAVKNYSSTSFTISDILLTTSMVSPLLLFTSSKIRDDFGTVSTMALETALFYFAIPFLGKATIDRYRPYVYNPEVPLEKKLTVDSKLSFFSGHTAPAFANAVFISKVYSDYYPDSEWKAYVWTVNLMLAATMGYLRYNAGAHFPTDIITGAIVGSAIGLLIPVIHKNSEKADLFNQLVLPRELIFFRIKL